MILLPSGYLELQYNTIIWLYLSKIQMGNCMNYDLWGSMKRFKKKKQQSE